MGTPPGVAIALQGCIHGEIDASYNSISQITDERRWRIPLLLWSGDVQTVRDEADLDSLACPKKYRALKDFHSYFNQEKCAPCLTLFIGGNHESSAFLHPLWFGGWVAPNIYYLGRSGVATVGNTRIAGLSGIYNVHDYERGYYEEPPFSVSSIRSVYHVREVEVRRLQQIHGPTDIVITHDWPTHVIQNKADQQSLLRRKPFFRDDLRNGRLGNPHLMDILTRLQPPVWVAAHLHVNFHTKFQHGDGKTTQFVTHDKPKKFVSTSLLEPGTHTLHLCYQPALDSSAEQKAKSRKREEEETAREILIDLEWLLILRSSWSEVPVGDRKTRGNNAKKWPLTWDVAKEIALQVEAKELGAWWERLDQEQGDLPGDTEIPENIELWKYTFELPSWEVLDYKSPWKQTEWWFSILGIPLSSVRPPFKVADSTPTAIAPCRNPLLDTEEEDIDLF